RWADLARTRRKQRQKRASLSGRVMSDEDPAQGMFARLKAGLSRTASVFSGGLVGLVTKERLDAETLEMLEDALVRSYVGTALAHELSAQIAEGRYDANISTYEVRALAADVIARALKPASKPLAIDASKKPFVILVAGVNGTGKTTTIGKLASKLRAE